MRTLTEIREERGVKKVAVQRLLGVSRPTYDRYEKFPGDMKVVDLDKVLAFLHCEKSDIFLSTEES